MGLEWHLDQGTGLNPTTADSVGLVNSSLGGDSLCIIGCWLTLCPTVPVASPWLCYLPELPNVPWGENMALAEDWFWTIFSHKRAQTLCVSPRNSSLHMVPQRHLASSWPHEPSLLPGELPFFLSMNNNCPPHSLPRARTLLFLSILLLSTKLYHLTGRPLLSCTTANPNWFRSLFYFQFSIVSHGGALKLELQRLLLSKVQKSATSLLGNCPWGWHQSISGHLCDY